MLCRPMLFSSCFRANRSKTPRSKLIETLIGKESYGGKHGKAAWERSCDLYDLLPRLLLKNRQLGLHMATDIAQFL